MPGCGVDFPDDDRMRISPGDLSSIYVQSRGGLRRELGKCLRTSHTIRHQHRHSDQRRARNEMVWITERRQRFRTGQSRVIGKATSSSGAEPVAIGTLVERTTVHDAAAPAGRLQRRSVQER